jgi:hypothetical protein
VGVLFERGRILAFIIGVGMNQNFAVAQLVGVYKNNIVCNKQPNRNQKESGDQLLYFIFECCFHYG